jgi:adenylate cyclase
MPVTPDAVRAQLERVLSSDSFAAAGRHSRFLRYIVERTLAGEGDQLKEYVLGTEVFDRADSYDPRLDSIVRVEARRLRTRLDDYYGGVGASDPVRIDIPRGTYVPVFAERVASTAPPARARAFSPLIVVAAALTVAVIVLAAAAALSPARTPAEASTVPGVAVLPFAHYTTEAADALFMAHLTDAVTAELARVGGVSVTSRTTAAQYAGTHQSIVQIAGALRVDFVLEASAELDGNTARVVARLVDGGTDRKVWVGEYRFDRADVTTAARTIAVESAAAMQRIGP